MLERFLWGRTCHAPSFKKNPNRALGQVVITFLAIRSPQQPLLCLLGRWFRIWNKRSISKKIDLMYNRVHQMPHFSKNVGHLFCHQNVFVTYPKTIHHASFEVYLKSSMEFFIYTEICKISWTPIIMVKTSQLSYRALCMLIRKLLTR